MSDIGLARGAVEVRPYDAAWKDAFESEKKLLLEHFAGEILEVSHGGSTSVPGMASKPIIDMFAIVANLHDADKLRERLEALIAAFPAHLAIERRPQQGAGRPAEVLMAASKSNKSTK